VPLYTDCYQSCYSAVLSLLLPVLITVSVLNRVVAAVVTVNGSSESNLKGASKDGMSALSKKVKVTL
jgi:hypothetical protein